MQKNKTIEGKRNFMKNKILLLLSIIVLCITGCSSVSQKDYDDKIKELKQVKADLNESQEELENTKKDLKEANKNLDNAVNEHLDSIQKDSQDEMDKVGAKSWGEEVFGKNTKVYVTDNQVFVVIDSKYTTSQKSIKKLWKKIVSGVRLYSGIYKTMPKAFPYDSVTIIARDKKTNLDMMTVQFIKNSDGSFSKNAITFNIDDFSKYMKALK